MSCSHAPGSRQRNCSGQLCDSHFVHCCPRLCLYNYFSCCLVNFVALCRFCKEAREKAKKAGAEQAWADYLDTDTVEELQVTELKSLDMKPPLSDSEEKARMKDQLDFLTSKMNTLTRQFQTILAAPAALQAGQSPFSVLGSMALQLSLAEQAREAAVNLGVMEVSAGALSGLPRTTTVGSRAPVTHVSAAMPVSVISPTSQPPTSSMTMSTSVGSPIMTPISLAPLPGYGVATSQSFPQQASGICMEIILLESLITCTRSHNISVSLPFIVVKRQFDVLTQICWLKANTTYNTNLFQFKI